MTQQDQVEIKNF